MPGGRPTKLNAEVQDAILDAVTVGNYRETAAAAAGISKVTLYNWIARGEEHANAEVVPARERPYVEFLNALERAEAIGEMTLLAGASAGKYGWQAKMTVLERRWPTKWGRSEKRYHEGAVTVNAEAVEVPSRL